MENTTTTQEEQQEKQQKKGGPSTNIINRANDFQRGIRSAKKQFDAFRDMKKGLNTITDPQSAITGKIPGLGGKNGIMKMSKELKNVKKIVQVASKIPLPVWIGIGIVVAVILLFFFIVTIIASLGGDSNSSFENQIPTPPTNSGGFSKVNGFKLTLDCSDEVPTTEGVATCTITYAYDSTIATVPLENIIIHFELPENTTYSTAAPTPTTKDSAVYSWPLSDPLNQKNILISFTNNQTDRYVDAYAYISFVDSGPGGGTTGGGTACTAPHEGTGPCSVAELSKVFTGDPSRAIAASMICQKESTSNPLTKNITSGTGCNMDDENNDDYSIGLFQINLIWHSCNVAGNGYSNSPSSERCQNLIDAPSRNSCENLLESSVENIQKAYQISSGGTDWSAWSTWLDHPEWNYVGVKSRLDNCGITVQ